MSLAITVQSPASTSRQSATASRPAGRIPGLDGLRALSFTIVLLAHLGFMNKKPGGFAVDVFFALSGYLITTLLMREYDRTGTLSLRSFYLRRTLRIFPAMYASLLVCTVLTHFHVLPGVLRGRDMVAEVFYLQNYRTWYTMRFGVLGCVPATLSYWSLCVEEHFYLLFPVALLWCLKREMRPSRIIGVLLLACAVFLAWRCFAVGYFLDGEQYCYRTSDARMDSILWGCVLALLEYQAPFRAWMAEGRRLGNLTVAGLAVIAATFTFHAVGHETFRFTIQAVCLLPVLYYVAHRPRSWAGWVLNHPLLVHLGELSYSLYLVHEAAIHLVARYVPLHSRAVVWPLSALLAYALALLLHRGVERPFQGLRSRFEPAAPPMRVRAAALQSARGAGVSAVPGTGT